MSVVKYFVPYRFCGDVNPIYVFAGSYGISNRRLNLSFYKTFGVFYTFFSLEEGV